MRRRGEWQTAAQIANEAGKKTFIIEKEVTQGVWAEWGQWLRNDVTITRSHICAASALAALDKAWQDGNTRRFAGITAGRWRVVGEIRNGVEILW